MTRYLHGGGIADYGVLDGGGGAVEFADGLTVLFWTARTGGSQITDLSLDVDGLTPVASTTTSNGSDTYSLGQIKPVYGPDEVVGMWAEVDGGPRVFVTTIAVASLVQNLIPAFSAHVAAHNGHSTAMGDLIDTDLGDPLTRTDGSVPRWDATSGTWLAASGSGATGAVLLDDVGQVIVPPPGLEGDPPWVEMTMPYSGGDTNPDSIQFFNETAGGGGGRVKTWWLNGNNELRGAPSTNNRVGARFFEAIQTQGYSNGRFFELSTNPTNPVSTPREALLGAYGQASGSKPGWIEATRVLSALQGVAAGGVYPTGSPLSQAIWRGRKTTAGAPAAGAYVAGDIVLATDGWWRCTAGGTPGTWVYAGAPGAFSDVTLGAHATHGTVHAAARVEQGGTVGRLQGSIIADATGITGGTTAFTLPAGMWPTTVQVCAVRRISTGANDAMTINTNGTVTFASSLTVGNEIVLGSITWPIV